MDLINHKTTGYHRKTSPEVISKLWLLLEDINYEKSDKQFSQLFINQMFNKFNIKYDQNKFNSILLNAIDDKLIIEDSSQIGFRYKPCFDRSVFEDLTNDWYCFECHSCNEQELVIGCKTCFRAFHKSCIKDVKTNEEFECIYCRKIKEIDNSLRINTISSTHLNKLISLLINNLEFSSEDVDIYEEYAIEENQKSNVLVYRMLDLIGIKHKALIGSYNAVQQFENDFKLFLHNFKILAVDERSRKLDGILKFEQRFNHEISELKLCIDCYLYSSETNIDNEDSPYEWFTEVCEPPHELVFAKLGNYPFWPSKVIQIKDNGKRYDVRFFDPPNFSRALIPKEKLRPIDYKSNDEELELPLELLEKHRQKLMEKGLDFPQTITAYEKNSSVNKRSKPDYKSSVKKKRLGLETKESN